MTTTPSIFADGIFTLCQWRCHICRSDFPTNGAVEQPGICPSCFLGGVQARLRIHSYVTGVDFGRKRDPTVLVTVDETDEAAQIVAFSRFLGVPWPEQVRRVAARAAAFPGRIFADATGLGDPVLQMPGMPAVEGVVFTAAEKTDMIQALMILLEQGRLKGPATGHGIERLWQELRDYRWDDEQQTQDCVMALALVARAVVRGMPGIWKL